jgi:uncharacterized SAM-binding protein YcdF (DUF218 family)
MIYLSKILPLFLSPIVVVCVVVVYGTIKRNRKIALAGIALLYLASTSFVANQLVRYAEDYKIKPDPEQLQKADAIVVLSGMLTSVQSSHGLVKEWRDPDRFFGGLELYKLGKSQKLIFTGGLVPWEKDPTTEGTRLKEIAESMGVPKSNILVTGEAQNTEQEAAALKKLLQGRQSILLVTSAFHMPRAKLLFESKGFVVYPYPVDFKVNESRTTLIDFFPNPHSLYLSDTAIREQIGLMYYRLK